MKIARSENAAIVLKKNSITTQSAPQTDYMREYQESAVYAETKSLTEYINIKENLIRTEFEIKLKYEIVVRNTKGIAVEINLEDQIPVSQNTNEIKVNLIDADGASLDEITGFLTWKLKLESKESKKIVFTYEIKYPKNKPVYGL